MEVDTIRNINCFRHVVHKNVLHGVLILSLILVIFACNTVAISNPSSVYCQEMGGTIEINNTPIGQQGLCVLPDGTEYDAWRFLEGKLGQNYSWCFKNGYGIDTICDGMSPYSQCRSVCIFPDGTTRDMGYLMGFYKEVYGIEIDPDKPKKHYLLNFIEGYASMLSNYTGQNYFDWRNVNGTNWMTIVKDQGSCGSCWAYATVGTIEAKYKIEHNDSSLDINLSERNLASDTPCCGCPLCGNYNGGQPSSAYDFIKNFGITTESCFPDINCNSNPSCSERCSDWKNNLWSIDGYASFYTSIPESSI